MIHSLTLKQEELMWKEYSFIAGVDEVGRGSLAGPLIAAAVVFPTTHIPITGIYDSKQLSSLQRIRACYSIINSCSSWGIGISSPNEIDTVGITHATTNAMLRALSELSNYDIAVIDGRPLAALSTPLMKKVVFITKGDSLVYSIAAASIVAKVFRDQLLINLHNIYPSFRWDKNKGYGTKLHFQAIHQEGATCFHRKLFLSKVKNLD